MNTPTETLELERKAGKNFDYERAANVLLSCLLNGVKQAAKDFGISERTVSNYKVRLSEDPYLAYLYTEKKNRYDEELSIRLTKACNSCLDFIERAAQSDEMTPEMIHSVVGALKISADIRATEKLMSARIGQLNILHEDFNAIGAVSGN